MAQIPKVAVIILSYNHKKDTLKVVETLLKGNTSGFKMEVIVIDNGSSDGTVTSLDAFPVKVISLPDNLGFTKANNVGMKNALERRFDYIALMNDDTIPDRDLVKNIFLEHVKHKDAGAISPKIYFAKGFEFKKHYKDNELGKVIWYAGGKIDWNNVYGSHHGVNEVDKGQFNKTSETDFATGCFVMYKSKALKEVGLFDERYFAYMEDVDHAQRMKKAGWKVLFSPKGILWHKVSQSSGIGSNLNDYFLTRNRMLFGMRYASLRTKFALARESIKILLSGRKWQKIAVRDYYLCRLGRGSWND